MAVLSERMAAEMDGGFVVFLIGVRLNRWWKVGSWGPVFSAMPRMLAELAKQPEMGLLHARSHFGLRSAMLVQYWRSYDHLEAYAQNRDAAHLPAWRAFNSAIGTNGDVGIWHETYVIAPGAYEAIFVNMPPFGLGSAGRLVPAKGSRKASRERLSAVLSQPGPPLSGPSPD